MNGWFTVERIDTQTFAISEYQHYEETHCYLLCGQNKAALIDTGLGVLKQQMRCRSSDDVACYRIYYPRPLGSHRWAQIL